jgi:hypothetical protein
MGCEGEKVKGAIPSAASTHRALQADA